MDKFVSRKRRAAEIERPTFNSSDELSSERDDGSTEVRLAMLASLCPQYSVDILLDALLVADGSVTGAVDLLTDNHNATSPRKKPAAAAVGYQSSLRDFHAGPPSTNAYPDGPATKKITHRGKTLHLYSPEDIASHTPCSIILNFLEPELANDLLRELLIEAPTFGKDTFTLFDRVVTSPHTMAFYVDDWDEAERQRTDYIYNGSYVKDVRRTPSVMRNVASLVATAVNGEITKRIRTHYPDQKKLAYQNPKEWTPNTAFVNCYDGARESVGYHSDQLTYLGPRAIIGSLSLGVAREFRVRKIVAREQGADNRSPEVKKVDEALADEQGQIAIHLPHNSLLVMHAEMQEEWKHAIAPAQTIVPHPLAGNKRLNITYRCYRPAFHPKYTPKCHCGVPTVLRCVQRRAITRGRYMWMCHAGYVPEGKKGCSFFQWAEFDDDGEPPWSGNVRPESKEENE